MSISDKYTIVKPLGEQNKRKFSSVFLVQNKFDHSLSVMKVLKKNNKNAHLIDRLAHESTFNFDQLGLPHTVDFFESDSELIVIRSFHEGDTLSKYWQSIKRKDRISFIIQLIEKLGLLFDVLRENNVVHCDIKPSNLIIKRANDDFDVALIDFGLALKKDDLDQRNILFPLGFAAPELLLNQLDLVDHRSDIYALGIVIWQLFVGELPLTHPNPSIFTNLQLTHPLPDHTKIPKGIYPILVKMCYKFSFAKPPNILPIEEVRNSLNEAMDKRYKSIQDVSTDLKQINPNRSFTIKGLFGNRC